MIDPVARAWAITRRSLGASLLALGGAAALRFWPRSAASLHLTEIVALPNAESLRVLGRRLLAAAPQSHDDIENRLGEKLAKDGYAAAVARDRASGALVAVDGWLLPETQTLAGAWLASV